METEEIEDILYRDSFTGQYFRGVYACDQLSGQHLPRPSALVVNTDPSNKPGQHWVAIYITRDGTGEYFDSFGNGPSVSQIVQFLGKNTTYVIPNRRLLQGAFSTVCGQYTIFFLLHRCRGLTMNKIINLFSADTAENDFNVNAFVKKHFPLIKTRVYDHNFIVRQLLNASLK